MCFCSNISICYCVWEIVLSFSEMYRLQFKCNTKFWIASIVSQRAEQACYIVVANYIICLSGHRRIIPHCSFHIEHDNACLKALFFGIERCGCAFSCNSSRSADESLPCDPQINGWSWGLFPRLQSCVLCLFVSSYHVYIPIFFSLRSLFRIHILNIHINKEIHFIYLLVFYFIYFFMEVLEMNDNSCQLLCCIFNTAISNLIYRLHYLSFMFIFFF